jgi:ERCC4-type nuclease
MIMVYCLNSTKTFIESQQYKNCVAEVYTKWDLIIINRKEYFFTRETIYRIHEKQDEQFEKSWFPNLQ